MFADGPTGAKSGDITPLYCTLNEEGIGHMQRVAPDVRLMPLFIVVLGVDVLGVAGVVAVALADASPFILSVPIPYAVPAASATAGTNTPASNFILNECLIGFLLLKNRQRDRAVPEHGRSHGGGI